MAMQDAPQEPLDFAFIKDRYDFELQRREHLTAALSLPVGVLSALGSVMVVMAHSFTFAPNLLSSAFCFSLVLGVTFFSACLFKLAQAYHQQTYVYMPPLAALEKTLEEWRAFYKEAGYEGAERDFFLHDLRARVIEAADRNTFSNDTRSAHIHRARIFLFLLLASMSAAGLIYTLNQVLVRLRG
jgi:hypothetical protein